MTLSQRIREFFGLPMKAGDSWTKEDGSTLTYLGKAPNPWETKQCAVCDGPATQFKTTPPWPETSYSHMSMTCDDHASYLDGVGWSNANGVYQESSGTSSCGICGDPYGECGHTAGYAAMAKAQEMGAVRGRL